MTTKKITELTASTTPESNDLIPMVIGPDESTPVTRKVTVSSLLGNGWIKVNDTWSYASPTTITIPAGGSNIYQIGDKIKLTQTTAKYFYVIGRTDTLLTVTGGTDYTVADAPITSPYYSHSIAVGFPGYFNFTPTFGATSGTLTTVASQEGKFSLIGRTVFYRFYGSFTDIGSGTGGVTVTMPIDCSGYLLGSSAVRVGADKAGLAYPYSSTVLRVFKYDGSFPVANGEPMGGLVTYFM